MWELMAIGIEMQKRMIEVHAAALKLASDAVREAGEQAASNDALGEMEHARDALVGQWLDFWRWRL